MFPGILLTFLFLLSSCNKELKFSKENLLSMALKEDPTVAYILPKSINEGVTCAEYGDGCISAHIVNVKGLEMIAVEFMTEANAKLAAQKLRGFYSRNWLFDDVTGEPSLERFVVKALEAKKP
jgi:hypothetical protein